MSKQHNPLKITWPECEQCGKPHDPAMPHDGSTLKYHSLIERRFGRPPTYADTLEHCNEFVRDLYAKQLERIYGLNINDPISLDWSVNPLGLE